MKCIAPILVAWFVFQLPQSSSPSPTDPVEPAHRLDFSIGGRATRIDLGVTVPAHDGVPELRAESCPTRIFSVPHAFTFEFPREWMLSGAANGAEGWWDVSGDGTLVSLQRHNDDPLVARDRYIENSLAVDIVAIVSEHLIAFGGREFFARSIEFVVGGLHWRHVTRVRQTVLGLRAANAA